VAGGILESIGLFGVIGAVILVTALLSGLVERSRLPQIVVFLALGVVLGPLGLGVVDLGVTSPTVQVIATVGLVLVLFTDSVSVRLPELKKQARLAAIILGPGTLLTAAVNGVAAYYLLGTGAAESAILGAALASTDPVLLRGLMRGSIAPQPARNALRIESGMNDAVLVPVILIAMATLEPSSPATSGGLQTAVQVFVLGAGAGVVLGFIAVGALDLVRKRVGMRRDYESLYALGVALAAFAIAEAIHGSGFIAAFASGLTVAALDVELCDCFYDYGEATAEMALIFTFVALGSSAIWTGLDVADGPTLLFAAVALFSRALILIPALAKSGLDKRSQRFVIWFGPRGLSSLLLVLLAVFAGLPGSERLFAVTSLVVLLSIVIHGGSQMLLRVPPRGGAVAQASGAVPMALSPRAATPAEPASLSSSPFVNDNERITLEEVDDLKRHGLPVTVLDVRTDTAFESEDALAQSAVRASPDRAVEVVRTLGLPPDVWLVSYCA
jgi:NhaP-type Na+/H+ or K+/H+ antiporter